MTVLGDEPRVKDGPVSTETNGLRETYLIEASDLDEALDMSVGLPGSRDGAIEIRPTIT